MVYVPAALAVNVTEQLDLLGPVTTKAQLLGTKVPLEGFTVKVTVPSGGVCVPLSMSVTVAVHVVGWSTTMGFGVQFTVVEVVRRLTVRLKKPVLVSWLGSPL